MNGAQLSGLITVAIALQKLGQMRQKVGETAAAPASPDGEEKVPSQSRLFPLGYPSFRAMITYSSSNTCTLLCQV